jgi:hypothetical protein
MGEVLSGGVGLGGVGGALDIGLGVGFGVLRDRDRDGFAVLGLHPFSPDMTLMG